MKTEPNVSDIIALHDLLVKRWHTEPITNPESGLRGVLVAEHEANFRLWHSEDEARRPDVDDAYIAEQKRTIDRWNQIRNDYIERIDETIIGLWPWIVEEETLPINTETPGSAFDRLSIASLKIFHMNEEVSRIDVDEKHQEACREKVARLEKQRLDLARALEVLLDDLKFRRKRLQVYRQFKMYNDPSLNPAVYNAKK